MSMERALVPSDALNNGLCVPPYQNRRFLSPSLGRNEPRSFIHLLQSGQTRRAQDPQSLDLVSARHSDDEGFLEPYNLLHFHYTLRDLVTPCNPSENVDEHCLDLSRRLDNVQGRSNMLSVRPTPYVAEVGRVTPILLD